MHSFDVSFFTVHFEKDEAGHPIRHIELEDKEVTEEEPEKTAEESMHEIVDAQKRLLDQWCFAEHYEPHVLLQVNGHSIDFFLAWISAFNFTLITSIL